jgi:hypothetical protein
VQLRELELMLSEQSVVFSSWRNSNLYQVMLANGLLASIWLNKCGDLERISIDKVNEMLSPNKLVIYRT